MSTTEPQRRPRTRKSIAHLPSSDAATDIVDKENQENDENQVATMTSKADTMSKKSRSKSIGPGGLDALQETSGNRRKSLAMARPKSILKPSIPLSPLKEIPSRKPNVSDQKTTSAFQSAKADPGAQSPNKTQSVPQSPSKGSAADPTSPSSGIKRSNEPGSTNTHQSPSTKTVSASPRAPGQIAPPSENEQDTEKQARQKQREEIQRQRDVRRKSMANRRVSFAPEATLHTWDVVEYMQDSTTSSASTNSTRRASAFAQSQGSSISAGRPQTPPEQKGQSIVERSPEHQRDVHQKKRRRSSGAPRLNDPDTLSSSPCSGSSVADGEDTIHSHQSFEEGDSSTSSSVSVGENGSTAYVTVQNELNNVPENANVDGQEDPQIEASLQEAAEQAGTRGIEFDENGDLSMEIAGDEVTAAFKPWVRQNVGIGSPHPRKTVPATQSQENVNPFSPAFGADAIKTDSAISADEQAADGEMSMDITRAVGGIVQPSKQRIASGAINRRPNNRRQSIAARRRSSGGSSAFEDGTMDFTAAIGGIQAGQNEFTAVSQVDENEDLSMEFTNVVGGLKNGNWQSQQEKLSSNIAENSRARMSNKTDSNNIDEDGDMEMTTAMGGILPRQIQQPANNCNTEDEMDMTKAIGGIVSSVQGDQSKTPKSPQRPVSSSKPRFSLSASATGSPNVSSTRSRERPYRNDAAKVESSLGKRPKTPSEQVTPQVPRPTTPGKTPPSANVAMRHPSPKKLFANEIKAARDSSSGTPKLFNQGPKGGRHTPKVIFAPNAAQERRFSSLCEDQGETSSPRIAALLDRRRSIGDQADVFAPQAAESRGVRFEDPKEMEREIVKDRDEDLRREKPQSILESEVNVEAGSPEENDATANLKGMIESMTPKKNKLKGRKSLAVGTAKGVLGKRPAELDDEDDEGTPRSYGKAGSPVKKIRLQARPSLAQTSGNARTFTPKTQSDSKSHTASTPKNQGRFKDADALASAQKPLPIFGEQAEPESEVGGPEDKISLQDFLNLTNMRFMDLTMTKRRHTTAPASVKKAGFQSEGEAERASDPSKQLEDAAMAGACTIPMLELYQHSCRELKKYMSEGRDLIREIETDIADENPMLFRDYVSATPAARAALDSQLKNLKTHARLVSKGTWYEWRMKLLEGLKESLAETENGLDEDEVTLTKQEHDVASILPSALKEQDALAEAIHELQAKENDFADSDPEELREVRQQLLAINEAIEEKTRQLEECEQNLQSTKAVIKETNAQIDSYKPLIRDAQRRREESRGWSVREVNSLQTKVDALEAKSGWSITSASGTKLSLSYLNEIQLFFDLVAFRTSQKHTAANNAPISLTYIGDDASLRHPKPLSTSSRFFLQLLRANLQALSQNSTRPQDLLLLVSAGWDRARAIAAEIKRLDLLAGITDAHIVGDERLAIVTAMLLQEVKTKVLVTWKLVTRVEGGDIKVRSHVTTNVVYGEGFGEEKMRDFLVGRIGAKGDGGAIGTGKWAEAVVALRKGLLGSKKARKIGAS